MQENLKRTIGVFGLACAVVNITVGTGIFVLPALVAENLGAAAIVCFFICGLLIFLIALCFAEVGSKVSVSGGTYVYIDAAFGPFAGTASVDLSRMNDVLAYLTENCRRGAACEVSPAVTIRQKPEKSRAP